MSPTPAASGPPADQTTALAPTTMAPIALAPGITIVPLIKLQADLEPFETNLEDIEGQVARAVISDQDRYQAGSDVLSAIQRELNALEAKRVEVKKPFDDAGKLVQTLCTPLKVRLEAAKATLNKKMLAWYQAEEERKRKAQEEIRRQQQEEAERLAAAARAQGQEQTAEAIEQMVAAAPAAPPPRVGMANYAGKTHTKRTYWLGEAAEPMVILKAIMDGLIPISAIEFNKAALNKIAADHIAKLPKEDQKEMVHLGIKITKDEKLV